MMIILYNMSII